MSYFTLAGFDGEQWGVVFGDYDKETVEDERDDVRDAGEYRKLRILRTGDKQTDIQSAIDHLNK